MNKLDIHKKSHYHESKTPFERIQSTLSSAATRKHKKIALFTDNILKNLLMGELNFFMENVFRIKSKTIKSSRHSSP